MRNFKLRAFDKTNKEMANNVAIVGRHIIFEHNSEGYDLDELELTYLDVLDGENEYAIMQYTGLKDKNDNEICEGDVVSTHKGDFVVKWDEIGGMFLFFEVGEPDSGLDYYEFEEEYSYYEFYVVGNIYEDPELLEDK